MSSGNDMLLRYAELCDFIDVEAGCKLTGLQPTTVVKLLASLVDLGKLRKFPYLHPRCYWHPHRPLGAQSLIYAASLSFRCILAEPRIWTPERREGPATIISSGSEREAVFIDYGASPRYLAQKVGDWADDRESVPLGLVVPTEAQAQAVSRYIHGIRYIVFPDLMRLQCVKARP
jgi:hypothetical protein